MSTALAASRSWLCSLAKTPWRNRTLAAAASWQSCNRNSSSSVLIQRATPLAAKTATVDTWTRSCTVQMGVKHFNRADYEFHSLRLLKSFEKVDPEKVTLDAHFKNDLGLDSLDHVELIIVFEDHFGIFVQDHEAEDMFTLQQVIDHMCALLKVDDPSHIYPHYRAPDTPTL